MKIFTHKQETWDRAKCQKEANRVFRDGMGTPGPRGIIASSGSNYPQYGQTQRYNGGTIVDGEWYEAVSVPLPAIHEDFCFESWPAWGRFIKKKEV